MATKDEQPTLSGHQECPWIDLSQLGQAVELVVRTNDKARGIGFLRGLRSEGCSLLCGGWSLVREGLPVFQRLGKSRRTTITLPRDDN
jgi:hypothetical protein